MVVAYPAWPPALCALALLSGAAGVRSVTYMLQRIPGVPSDARRQTRDTGAHL